MSLDDELKKCTEEAFTAPDEPVYHYTNEKNYDEILRCEYLNLNSHLYLNSKDKTNQELCISVNLIIDALKNNNLEHLVDNFERFITRGIVYYTVSFCCSRSIFCAKKYGNYHFEFIPELFKHFQASHQSTLFSKVEYNIDNQNKIITKIFNIYNKRNNQDNEPIVTLFTWLAVLIPLFKGNEHKYDNECRVIQAEIFTPNSGKLFTPIVTKKIPFKATDILKVYRE